MTNVLRAGLIGLLKKFNQINSFNQIYTQRQPNNQFEQNS